MRVSKFKTGVCLLRMNVLVWRLEENDLSFEHILEIQKRWTHRVWSVKLPPLEPEGGGGWGRYGTGRQGRVIDCWKGQRIVYLTSLSGYTTYTTGVLTGTSYPLFNLKEREWGCKLGSRGPEIKYLYVVQDQMSVIDLNTVDKSGCSYLSENYPE